MPPYPIGTTRFTVTGMPACGFVECVADTAESGMLWTAGGNDDPPRQAASTRHAPAMNDERARNERTYVNRINTIISPI